MIRKSKGSVRALKGTYLALVLAFLYLPILVMFGLSFNASVSRAEWTGFTLDWYVKLFQDQNIINALKVTLSVAVIATIVSVIIGTLGAIGMYSMNKGWFNLLSAISNIPMTMPDIVTGVSLMLMFVFVNTYVYFPRGFFTMLIAHVTFNRPYVLLSVMPRFKQLDKSLSEAAQDLGCTPSRAFFMVELPEIVPGIISGLMMSFTLSLDDFVISHFVSSPNFQTLPLYVYNQTAHNVKFSMYALSALIVAVILTILLVVNFAGSAADRKGKKGGRS